MEKINNMLPDKNGYYGEFGGIYLPVELKEEFIKIADEFLKLKENKNFNDELNYLLKSYVGRPSPIYHCHNLSKEVGCEIYLKREDLNHTGAHKINHSIGEALLAKHMGKTKIIAETGAGQHGVAVATAAALVGLNCDIYMGEVDVKKEEPNVQKIKMLGANVKVVKFGQKTLKEAVDAAFKNYLNEYKTAIYAIGSVVGPHPYPMIVEHFQSVIGKEARRQFLELTNSLPDYVIACVGGGSNSIGLFNGFLDDKNVNIIGVEPLGKGSKIGQNAATISFGEVGILHGFKSLVLKDKKGNIANAYSVASGLDYPGVGPKHCYLNQINRVKYKTLDDKEAIDAFYKLSRKEGIIPALESSHALGYALKLAKKLNNGSKILVNLSGRGDKDVNFVLKNYPLK